VDVEAVSGGQPCIRSLRDRVNLCRGTKVSREASDEKTQHPIRVGGGACAALALAAAACGDDSDDGDDSAGTSSSDAGERRRHPIEPDQSRRQRQQVHAPQLRSPREQRHLGVDRLNPHQVSGTYEGQEVLSETHRDRSVSLQLPKAGVFDYHCTVHGDAMKGTITVR
jgi:hypothetical protein